MRKVLIVSPRFPPTNAADLHRVRVSVAHYRSFGWEPTILCIDPVTADCIDDPELAQSLPENLPVIRVPAWSEAKCRRFGFGQLGYRSLLPLYRAGCRLLRREHPAVVFFSTTVFLCFVLGPLWKQRYGCRIVYDFQDPWYNETLPYTPATVPGRWWKYRVDQWLARHLEHFALRRADHIIAVSQGYVASLSRRYPRLAPADFTVVPFAAGDGDYDFLRRRGIRQRVFRAAPGLVRWVYAGRGGADMAPVLSALFECIAALARDEPRFAERLRLHFVGTDYAPVGRARKRVESLAQQQGITALVEELPARLPYFEALSLYLESDAILLIGSIDRDYTASKLLTCVASKKPVLALFHRASLVAAIAERFANVRLATFDESPAEPGFRDQVARGIAWLRAPSFDPAAIDAALQPWSAEELTRRQCAIFDRVSTSPALPARLSEVRPQPLR